MKAPLGVPKLPAWPPPDEPVERVRDCPACRRAEFLRVADGPELRYFFFANSTSAATYYPFL